MNQIVKVMTNMEPSNTKVKALVLDAGPLITQSASSLMQHAQSFYTTPGVHAELKDEQSRQQLILWGDRLKIRHPKQEFITKVTSFSKLTGDYAVLSVNDLHIIALAYELEVELNNGDWRLRSYPGEVKQFLHTKLEEMKNQSNASDNSAELAKVEETSTKEVSSEPSEEPIKPKKPRRRGGKKQREKREAALQKQLEEQEQEQEQQQPLEQREAEVNDSTDKQEQQQLIEESDIISPIKEEENSVEITEEFDEEDDDGEWITPENLQEEMLKDDNELIQESKKPGPFIKVALSTGDFACQNVAMQIGLNLMNSMSGKQIKRVRNYMYRCHACFKMTPIP